MKYPFPVPSPNPSPNHITPRATSEVYATIPPIIIIPGYYTSFLRPSLTIEGNTGKEWRTRPPALLQFAWP